MINLKPCPFCGGEAEVESHGNHRQSTIISCGDCGVTHESGDEGEMVGRSWNERVNGSKESAAFRAVSELNTYFVSRANREGRMLPMYFPDWCNDFREKLSKGGK